MSPFFRRESFIHTRDERYSPDVVTEDTYAVHRWAETWVVRKVTLRKKLERALLKRFSLYAPELAFRMSYNMAKRG